MKTKLEHAEYLARRGFYIFRLAENSKFPVAGIPWRDVSTRDIEKIRSWWRCPVTGWEQDFNIGIDTGKSGLYVIDVDTKEGKVGARSFAQLDMIHGFPATVTVTTASGGKHHYYTGAGLRNTTSKLAQDIDTRGEGGFVVAPGSVIDGKTYIEETELVTPVPLPGWIAEQLAAYKSTAPQQREKIMSNDNPDDITRAKQWLLTEAQHAIQGAGGDNMTFATAAKLREFGVSEQTALDLMLDHWNDDCSPPWEPEDLQRKVENAYKFAAKPQGSASAHAEFGLVAPVSATNQLVSPLQPFLIDKLPPRQWVFGRMALAKKVTLLVAPPGVGKSTFTLLMALSKATGRNLLGIQPHGRGAVAMHNNEDDLEEQQRRLGALMHHYNISFDDLFDNDAKGAAARPLLYLNSGEQRMLKIAQRTGQTGTIKPLDADELTARLIEARIKMLIVDPFSETHPASENDNNEILEVAKIYRSVAQQADCSITLVHHDRKPEGASAEGHIGNMYGARGASSLTGVTRVVCTLHSMPARDGKRYGVKEEDRSNYMRLDFAKANLSKKNSEPLWYEWKSERLGGTADDPDSGESVGVVAPVRLVPKNDEADAERVLLLDVEALVEGSGPDGLAVSEVAEQLVSSFPMHQGKRATALTRAIKQILEAADSIEAANGRLSLYERKKQPGDNARTAKWFVRWLAAE